MRVFLDTNVLVSALATRGLAADVLRVVLTEHTLVTGEVVLTELRRVLKRKLKLPASLIDDFVELLREHDVVPKPAGAGPVKIRDRDDQWVLASAVEGTTNVLVTGDKDLLAIAKKSPIPIIDPRGFWTLLRRA